VRFSLKLEVGFVTEGGGGERQVAEVAERTVAGEEMVVEEVEEKSPVENSQEYEKSASKPVPVTVTGVEPFVGPDAGEMEVIEAMAEYVKGREEGEVVAAEGEREVDRARVVVAGPEGEAGATQEARVEDSTTAGTTVAPSLNTQYMESEGKSAPVTWIVSPPSS
jgi:hypothetical protein